MIICLYKELTPDRQAHTVHREPTLRPDLDLEAASVGKSRAAAQRRIREVRAADLQEEIAEMLSRSVISNEDGGFLANIAASGASNRTQRDARAAQTKGEP